jgi:hypothetical protein
MNFERTECEIVPAPRHLVLRYQAIFQFSSDDHKLQMRVEAQVARLYDQILAQLAREDMMRQGDQIR